MCQDTIKLMLWKRKGSSWDIYSRGSTLEIYGDECVYIGPAPDRTTYFWVSSGDYRYLTEQQLAEAGYRLSPTYPKEV